MFYYIIFFLLVYRLNLLSKIVFDDQKPFREKVSAVTDFQKLLILKVLGGVKQREPFYKKVLTN
jgi:hypothetical protein